MINPPETIGDVLAVVINRHGYNRTDLGDVFNIPAITLGSKMKSNKWLPMERTTILNWLRETNFIK